MPVPAEPKIYHIVHVDRLSSIATDGFLFCDAEIGRRNPSDTVIGMNDIKQRRLQLPLQSHPGLHVGDCVPFYFCPRSVMLYMINMRNPDLAYKNGQQPIVHLEADFGDSVAWAEQNNRRWAFTSSNAGSYTFDDYCDLGRLNQIDWDAVQANQWKRHKHGKQAEFLLENRFPWHLIERIGVYSRLVHQRAANSFPTDGHRPKVEILKAWYY